MKRAHLLQHIDQELLDALFGFCYKRTDDSHRAQELCSDIVFELVKLGNTEGDIGTGDEGDTEALYAFIWRVARNVYADYADRRRRERSRAATGDAESLLALLSDEDDTAEREALRRDAAVLTRIYRHIANLTRAYREVMIAYYLDGMSTRDIAAVQGVSENTIRQRLFSARETVRKEVNDMEKTVSQKPVALQHLELELWGGGDPTSGDPRSLIERQLSRHILWLCRDREMSARDIAEELNVPMLYVEEELALQVRGVGKTGYGTLRKLPNGRYISNLALLTCEQFLEGRAICEAHTPAVCREIRDHLRDPDIARQYFTFPYLGRVTDEHLHLIWWQHLPVLIHKLGDMVDELLRDKYLADVTPAERPFHVCGFEQLGTDTDFCGWDGINGSNLCGFRHVSMENLYTRRLRPHFHCGHDMANDGKIQIALRAIDGLPVSALNEDEREVAAKAVACGYLMRVRDEEHTEDMLYTKILVMSAADRERVYLIDDSLRERLQPIAEQVAEQTAAWLRRVLPAHLLPEYVKVAHFATSSVFDAVLRDLTESGLLEIPAGGIGAEGCWMTVTK